MTTVSSEEIEKELEILVDSAMQEKIKWQECVDMITDAGDYDGEKLLDAYANDSDDELMEAFNECRRAHLRRVLYDSAVMEAADKANQEKYGT